ncbi:MAG TPA: hypothetical protein VFK02_15445, partial [Kofleriaceae bacterium]|nr:hypothetical protein [Kofleriaceae bacterium]
MRRQRRIVSVSARVLVVLASLYIVFRLYLDGNPVLAAAAGSGLALTYFVYTSRRTYTHRYLFPGLAAIALFILLPLVYTVWIAFTNYGSRNLITFERATEVLLGEVRQSETVRYQFTLHRDGDGYRIVLDIGEPAGDAAPAGDTAPAAPAGDTAPAAPGSASPSAGSESRANTGPSAGDTVAAPQASGAPAAAAPTAGSAAGSATASTAGSAAGSGTAPAAAPATAPAT